MPVSRKRGGAKTHRKKLKARNQRIMSEVKKQNAFLKEAMMEQIEKLRAESGETENQIIIPEELNNTETNGLIQSTENV